MTGSAPGPSGWSGRGWDSLPAWGWGAVGGLPDWSVRQCRSGRASVGLSVHQVGHRLAPMVGHSLGPGCSSWFGPRRSVMVWNPYCPTLSVWGVSRASVGPGAACLISAALFWSVGRQRRLCEPSEPVRAGSGEPRGHPGASDRSGLGYGSAYLTRATTATSASVPQHPPGPSIGPVIMLGHQHPNRLGLFVRAQGELGHHRQCRREVVAGWVRSGGYRLDRMLTGHQVTGL